MQPEFMEPPDFQTRESDALYSEVMTMTAKVVRSNRKEATRLLEKANEVEERAAVVANTYRELAAALVIEAAEYARDQADNLLSEFPLEDRTASTEMPDA